MLNLPSDTLLRVKRPLYGIPKAKLHWYRTYNNHQKKSLSFLLTINDPFFLYTNQAICTLSSNDFIMRGPTCHQTDDTARSGNNAYIQMEAKMASRFGCKSATVLKSGKSVIFNSAEIGFDGTSYFISQRDHLNKLKLVDENN